MTEPQPTTDSTMPTNDIVQRMVEATARELFLIDVGQAPTTCDTWQQAKAEGYDAGYRRNAIRVLQVALPYITKGTDALHVEDQP